MRTRDRIFRRSTPQTDRVVPLFNPRLHSWDDHFAMQGPRVEGRTEIGRATVPLLNMNESERLDMRAELLARGDL